MSVARALLPACGEKVPEGRMRGTLGYRDEMIVTSCVSLLVMLMRAKM